jgi:hypothetical protein
MTLALSRPVRRIVALALLAIAVIGTWAGLIDPLLSAFAEREENLERSQRLLTEFTRKAGQRPIVEQQLQDARRRQATVTGFIDGANPALAAATLQNLVKVAVEGRGGTLRSLQALPASREAEFQKIAIRIDASAGADKLLDLFFGIEASRAPVLRIENLDIRGPEGWRDPSQVADNTNLTIRADIVAYLREARP